MIRKSAPSAVETAQPWNIFSAITGRHAPEVAVPSEEVNLKIQPRRPSTTSKNKMVMKLIDESQHKLKEASLAGEDYDHLRRTPQAARDV
jgi:hypothetical protein